MPSLFSRQLMFRLVAVGASLVSTVLVAEFFLRTLYPVHYCDVAQTFQHDPDLGVSFVPGLHVLQTTDYQQEVQVNRLGTINFQKDFSGYRHLVFTIGDSFTQGVGLPVDASYPAQLDLMLNLRGGQYQPLFGVVNLGMGGYGGRQNFLQLEKYCRKIGRPNFILYLGCQNDEQDDAMFQRGERHRAIFPNTPSLSAVWKFRLWITRETEIGRRARLAWGQLHEGTLLTSPKRTGDTAFPSQIDNINTIAKYAREIGAFLVVGWASDDADYLAMKRWASDNHVAFADWAPAVRSMIKINPSLPQENPHSGGHYRTWVNTVIAKSYADLIWAHQDSFSLNSL